MTQEEKQLLLQDLSARLPYEPMCEFTDTEDDFCKTTNKLGYSLRDFVAGKVIIKPYLRPLSSMEKSEIADAIKYIFGTDEVVYTSGAEGIGFYAVKNKMRIKVDDLQIKLGYYGINNIDWLNKYHFDYRGLIPMGLALEATEGMYNTKTE